MGKNTKKFAIGTIFAAAAGYLAGILTAPKSGKETRKDIGEAAKKAKVASEKELKQLHSQLNDLISQGKTQAGKLSETAKKDLNLALDKAGIAKEKVRDMLSSAHEGVTEDKDLKKAVDDATSAVSNLKKFVKNQASNVKKA